MLHSVVDWQRWLLEPWLAGLRLGQHVGGNGPPLWQRLLMAQHVLAERTMAAGDASHDPIEIAVARDHPGVSSAETVDQGPFARLVRFRAAGNGPPSLLVAPHSGYAGAVLSGLAAALLREGDVYFLDWLDARFVPQSHGRFGLDEQLAVVVRALVEVGAPAHLVGVSQSGAVALAAAALAAGPGATLPRPRSLVLLGAPLAPARQRTAVGWLAASVDPRLVDHCLLSVVPDRYPGAGRRVYPGLLQLMAVLLADPGAYCGTQAGLWLELLAGRPGTYDRLHADLHRLVDVPAELYVESVDDLVRRSPLGDSSVTLGSHAIPTGNLAGLPMLTVEAGRDELVGAGATHAVLRLAGPGSSSFTVPEAGHHALFVGPVFAGTVAPPLRRFLRDRR